MAVNIPGTGAGGREPLGWAGAVTETLRTVVPVLILFKVLNWTPDQMAGAIIAIGSILKLAELVWTRARVTPVNSPVLPAGTVVSVTGNDGTAATKQVVTNSTDDEADQEGPA